MGIIAYGSRERIPPPAGLTRSDVVLGDLPRGVLRVGGVLLAGQPWPWHPSFTNLVDPLLAPHMISPWK